MDHDLRAGVQHMEEDNQDIGWVVGTLEGKVSDQDDLEVGVEEVEDAKNVPEVEVEGGETGGMVEEGGVLHEVVVEGVPHAEVVVDEKDVHDDLQTANFQSLTSTLCLVHLKEAEAWSIYQVEAEEADMAQHHNEHVQREAQGVVDDGEGYGEGSMDGESGASG